MDISCYKSTPKFIGAVVGALYQNPTLLFTTVAGGIALVGI